MADGTKERKRRPKPDTGSDILKCSHEVQVDEVAKALLREYMHKRGFANTLRAFDEEDPRTSNTIQSRKLMMEMMFLKTKYPASIMEGLCTTRIAKRITAQQLSDLDTRIAAAKSELQQVTAKVESQQKVVASLPRPEGKEKKKKDKGEKGDKAKAEGKEKGSKKKDSKLKKEKKAAKAARDPSPAASPPRGAPDAAPLFSSDIGLGYKTASANGQLGFGGRDWKPPAAASSASASSASWPKRNFAAGSEFQDYRDQMLLDIQREREKLNSTLNKAGDPVTPPDGPAIPAPLSTQPEGFSLKSAQEPSSAGLTSPPASSLKPRDGAAVAKERKVSFA